MFGPRAERRTRVPPFCTLRDAWAAPEVPSGVRAAFAELGPSIPRRRTSTSVEQGPVPPEQGPCGVATNAYAEQDAATRLPALWITTAAVGIGPAPVGTAAAARRRRRAERFGQERAAAPPRRGWRTGLPGAQLRRRALMQQPPPGLQVDDLTDADWQPQRWRQRWLPQLGWPPPSQHEVIARPLPSRAMSRSTGNCPLDPGQGTTATKKLTGTSLPLGNGSTSSGGFPPARMNRTRAACLVT